MLARKMSPVEMAGMPWAAETSAAWVAPGTRADGSHVVLKVALPHMEGRDEIAGLRFWNGDPTVRLIDADERLVGVAFLDVGVYVTSLRSVKNLLLIGDAVKSVFFVAFQVCFTLAGTLSSSDVLV